MAGRPQQREAALAERRSIMADLEELGLADVVLHCPETVRRLDPETGDELTVPCGRGVVKGRLRCIRHKASDRSVPQILANNEAIADVRAYLANRLVPKAAGALEDVLDDEHASHADRTRAAIAVLDRSGLPAGVKIEAEVTHTVKPPAEAMADALRGVRERLEAAGVLPPDPDVGEFV